MSNLTKLTYIQYLCEKKLTELGLHEDKRYLDRLEREITNIEVQNIADYIISALKRNITIDEHGSLMYYLLGISKTDPIKLNIQIKLKKQSSFPDIDTDFSVNEREQVIKYFIDKYGSDHVAPIGSYGQMKMKMVTRDVARIFDIDLNDTNEVVKNLGDDIDAMTEEEFDIEISREPGEDGFRKDIYELRQYFERHPEIKEIIFKLRGQLRHLTKHPAGVVAVPTKIDETIPLMKHKDILITSWVDGVTRKDLQSSGFIKFDILGLKTLTIIKEILELIRERNAYNKDADYNLEEIDEGQHTSLLYEKFSEELSLNGNDVIYNRFRNTDTNGIFQFECLADDTWIGNYRINELYKRFAEDPESVHKIGSVNIKKKVKVRQKIAAMQKKKKIVYRLVIKKDNICIEATLLHRFYTKKGWKRLKDIQPGDYVLIDQVRNRAQYYCEQYDIVVDNVGVGPNCRKCIKNGQRLCAAQTLSKFKKYKQRYRFIAVKSVTVVGEKDVYDIAFSERSHHNYVANGFVVHNSALMKSLLKEIKPTTFTDITSATALGRPGPLDMGMHKEYAKRKNGKSFDFGSPLIEKCLKESFGILVYQEDVMRLCHMVAGFPLDLTDAVRKNLMKSIRDGDARDKAAKERKKIKDMFIEGFKKNGLTKKVAESWWQNCTSFARYGFNKCFSGDTLVTRCNGNQHTKREISIKDLYHLKRSKTAVGKKYRRLGFPKILAMSNGRVKPDKIKDIYYNGKKDVYKMTTIGGYEIKTTDNHKFMSRDGWKEVKHFKIDDDIAVTNKLYCPSCHKKEHYKNGQTKRYEKGHDVFFDKIKNIEYVGIEDTYDVEMYGEEHNLIANGFVSHNSHAVAYTVLSYQMMWFKVYYQLEFFVVLFSNSPKEKFTSYFAEAMSKGIKIMPVDITKTKKGFSIHSDENSIMFGLSHINGVGPAVIDVILRSQPFNSFEDFWEKTAAIKKVSKGVMLALINAHAFDCFGEQNDILEKYFKEIRKDKKWERDVDYNDKKFEHDKFVEAYSLDWRSNISNDHKLEIKRLGAKLLTKFIQPKLHLSQQVWGIVTEVVQMISKANNHYYYVLLVDSRFNIVKMRIPCYNRRCKKAFIYDQTINTYKKVSIDDVIKVDNILIGKAETSEYMSRIFIDLYDICCLGNVYDKTQKQKEKLAKYDDILE